MGKFQRGTSGNPAGRPAGSRSASAALLDQIGADAAADVLTAVIRKARKGDADCARLILQRCWPARKARVRFPMPSLTTTTDLPGALAAVATAISEGVLSPDEAAAVAQVLSVQAHSVELAEIDRRMKQIERRLADEAAGPT